MSAIIKAQPTKRRVFTLLQYPGVSPRKVSLFFPVPFYKQTLFRSDIVLSTFREVLWIFRPIYDQILHRFNLMIFYARRYASAIYAILSCPSVCLSVRHKPVLCQNRKTYDRANDAACTITQRLVYKVVLQHLTRLRLAQCIARALYDS